MAPSQSLTKCAGCCALCCQAPVNHFGLGPESPQGRPYSSSADYLQFSTSATGSRPQTVQFQHPVRRQLRRGQRRLPQPLADRTLDAAHPIPGAGVAQSLRGQTGGNDTVFLENRWWRISSPSSVMPPAIRRHCPQQNLEMNNRLLNMLERRNGHANGNSASEPA